MSVQTITALDLLKTNETYPHMIEYDEFAHLVVHHNSIVSSHLIPGLEADIDELPDGISARIRIKEGAKIRYPVHLCFGMMPEDGLQKIIMDIDLEERSKVSIFAHCTFPNAVNVEHLMDGKIRVGPGAQYNYQERHIHGKAGGVKVLPKTRVQLDEGARFKTGFELIKGYVGSIEIDYETTCNAFSVMEMDARINGKGSDDIKIREIGHLVGEGARGILTSRIAVRDQAQAHVYNRLTATAPFARGHVDCKEIVQGNGVATAVPIVEVRHPKAHITHEAAIGSVDSKQLETLMSRGLSEEDAVELIIEGLLS